MACQFVRRLGVPLPLEVGLQCALGVQCCVRLRDKLRPKAVNQSSRGFHAAIQEYCADDCLHGIRQQRSALPPTSAHQFGLHPYIRPKI